MKSLKKRRRLIRSRTLLASPETYEHMTVRKGNVITCYKSGDIDACSVVGTDLFHIGAGSYRGKLLLSAFAAGEDGDTTGFGECYLSVQDAEMFALAILKIARQCRRMEKENAVQQQ
jgi:hypothetical protein